MKFNTITRAITCTLILSGCSLAPKYQTPTVPLSEQWIGVALQEQATKGNTSSTPSTLIPSELGWRDFFLDPRLQALIETALKYNHDLRKAALNVELMQAQYGITQASKLPVVGLNGGYTRNRAGNGYISKQYNVGLGVSNFELDFFGRVKNQSAAALHKYLATKEARDAAQLSIINAVAKTYYQWRISTALKDLSKKTLNTRQQSYQLMRLRVQEGLSSGTDLSTAQTLVASARSVYQQQLRALQQTENTLAVIVGQPLEKLALPTGKHLTQQFPDKKLFVGIPSEALLKRPDIRQAEYTLKSANANIGVARASLFPSISLTANTGYASTELHNLFDGGHLWSFAPSIKLPLFDAGQRRANVKISEINKQITVETYLQTVQAAFRDVNDALTARETLAEQYRAEKQGQAATAKTLRLVTLQAQEGLANGLNVLDAERAHFSTQQGLLGTLLQVVNNNVDLYTALGGGLTETQMVKTPMIEAQMTEVQPSKKP